MNIKTKYYDVLIPRPSSKKMLSCVLHLGFFASAQMLVHSLYAICFSAILALITFAGITHFSFTEAFYYLSAVFVPLNVLRNGLRFSTKSVDWGKVYFATVLFWMVQAGVVFMSLRYL